MATHSDNLHPTGRGVIGIGGPGADEGAPDGQSALKLHRGISVIAFVLSAGVTAIFVMEGTMVPAIIFAVVTLGCAGAFVWANSRLRAGQRGAVRSGAEPDPGADPDTATGHSGATAH
jgi:hypothetical protein